MTLNVGLNLIAASIAFLSAAILMPVMMKLAIATGTVDKPGHRKIHTKAVPYLGGLGLWIAFLVSTSLCRLFPGDRFLDAFKLWSIVIASGAAMIIGLIDDRYQIRARNKLFAQVALAGVVVFFVGRFEFLTLPGLPLVKLSYFSVPFTIFWIVTAVNAINLIDGMDGLAGTVSVCVLASLMMLSKTLGDGEVSLLSSIGLGGVLGFLIYNRPPARIYLGDAGSHGLGMFIAVSLLVLGTVPTISSVNLFESHPNEPYLYQVLVCTMLIAYPALEITLSVARRLSRGKSIGSADRNHIHHALLQKGWNATSIAMGAGLFQLLCAAVVISIQSQFRGLTAWLLATVGLLMGMGLHYCGYVYTFLPSRVRETRPHFLIANHFINMQKLKLELAECISEIMALVNQTAVEFELRRYALTLPGKTDSDDEWRLEWVRPKDVQGTLLPFLNHQIKGSQIGFVDQFVDAESGGYSDWEFEYHHIEEDIDVEYRVLMSEFMRKALIRALILSRKNGSTLDASKELPASITASLLKRRAQNRPEIPTTDSPLAKV
jgi:UDP-GlcNAc:undecaprenyl-phosphate/decaprenyl-phosphate GlcNAc-1-phosphate transferase